jgi:uncharacterized protein
MSSDASRESAKSCDDSERAADNSGHRVSRRAMLARTVGAAAAIALAPHLKDAAAAAADETDWNVWDGHVHLTGTTGTVEERVDQLLTCADRLGIARLVVHLGFSIVGDPTPDDLRKENDEVLRAIAHAPDRVLGFVYLNPKHAEASQREIERCVCNGPMVGIKLLTAIHCNQPELDPIVRRAVELKIPVLQHTFLKVGGNSPGESYPTDVAELAARHPEASFIAAHTGADWERGIRDLRASKNVCAEISGSDPTAGFVEMAVRELGAERVSYGSDAGGRSFASQLAKAMSADIPDEAKRLVVGGNLRRMLKPILERKGMKS